MPRGYLSLILHAHLPFVRHPEHAVMLEEDWLFEAITETYVPLLDVLAGLVRDGIPFRLAMSLTPPLADMLRDDLLIGRYRRHLDRLLAFAERERDRTRNDPAMHALASLYQARLEHTRRAFTDTHGGDLVSAFQRFQENGSIELIACAATHGFLPLLLHEPAAVRAQLRIGRDAYRAAFHRDPQGWWLPECAYVPELDPFLREAEVRWFLVDAHGLWNAQPRPRCGIYAPVFTPAGPAAFARDPESGRQVWSRGDGYPGDPAYRDFYRDAGFDLTPGHLGELLLPTGERRFTGFKYHRITGPGTDKAPYDPALAAARVQDHARHFVDERLRQAASLAEPLGRPPVIVAPFDAELFGHWWFEGPQFIDAVLRECAARPDGLQTVTPWDCLQRQPTHQLARPAASTWGRNGHAEVWLNDKTAWIYPHLHHAARRMTDAARTFPAPDPLQERTLRQMTRELLLAQSSDWAFILETGSSPGYARRRIEDHLRRFERLNDGLITHRIEPAFLAECESRDNLFPNVDWRHYAAR